MNEYDLQAFLKEIRLATGFTISIGFDEKLCVVVGTNSAGHREKFPTFSNLKDAHMYLQAWMNEAIRQQA